MKSDKLKIVFSGSVGSGKTTAIESISDVDTFTTEEAATDDVKLMKQNTTVAMDYGQLHLSDGNRVHLYGTPGQKRFDYMWEILAEGALGVVVILNCTVEDCLDQLDLYLNAFKKMLSEGKLVIAVTHTDLLKGCSILEIKKHARKYAGNVPVFTVDARSRKEVSALVMALLFHIDSMLD